MSHRQGSWNQMSQLTLLYDHYYNYSCQIPAPKLHCRLCQFLKNRISSVFDLLIYKFLFFREAVAIGNPYNITGRWIFAHIYTLEPALLVKSFADYLSSVYCIYTDIATFAIASKLKVSEYNLPQRNNRNF